MYQCPMHPDVQQKKRGRCPKCGMKLVESSKLTVQSEQDSPQRGVESSYTPLIVVVSFILITTLAISYRDFALQAFLFQKTIAYFMIGFFLVFSAFKFMDLNGFAQGYSTYDLLAKRWFTYGYIYPFIELIFGISMILTANSKLLLGAECMVMTFSGIGVLIKLFKHEKFQCACLGTFLKVPLTKVTVIEDFGMALLAIILLFI